MPLYEVHFADEAWEPIQAQARYIAIDKHAPENASRWLTRLLDAIDSLERMPHRHAIDQKQSNMLGTQVYRMVFERRYLVYYAIDEKRRRVNILSFRHGAQKSK